MIRFTQGFCLCCVTNFISFVKTVCFCRRKMVEVIAQNAFPENVTDLFAFRKNNSILCVVVWFELKVCCCRFCKSHVDRE
jgi:hypothetical protein